MVGVTGKVELITPAEYARHRGVSREAVRKAINTGRIILIDGKIDPAVADIQWEKNTNPSQRRDNPPAAIGANDSVGDTQQSTAGIFNINTSRAKREHFDAELSEMRARKEAGDLVVASEITSAITTAAAMIRSALERMPDKLADRLAAETSATAIHALMQTEIDQVLDDMTFAVLALRGEDAEVVNG